MKIKLNVFLPIIVVAVACCILSGCGTSSLGNLPKVSQMQAKYFSDRKTLTGGKLARPKVRGSWGFGNVD